jgi:DNA-binding NtrC family response regulator
MIYGLGVRISRIIISKEPKMRSKWSILIVDDELGVRESLRMLLKPYYEIHTAADGEEALNIIKERKVHLVTLDLNMPRLSGIETLRQIRKVDGEVPIIIITGYGTQKDEEEAFHYGVKDFIAKPFNTAKIVSLINEILGKGIEQNRGEFKRDTFEM